jgi:hypothetical protein
MESEQQTTQPQITEQKKEIRLVDIPVTDENVALNIMISFVNLAQKRGAYNLDESSKIWECIKKFQKST